MFTDVATLNGGTQLIATATIIRFRPSFGEFESPDATLINYANQFLFSADTAETIAQKIGTDLPIAKLTTPNGLDLFVDAAKVVDIAEPISGHHNSKARSVIRVATLRIQLRETTNQARTKIEDALLASGGHPGV